MDFFSDFNKLFGRKIISLFIWLYIYCFVVSLDSNFFMCSYLRFELSIIENNIYIVFFSFIFFILYNYLIKIKYSVVKIINYINVNYIYVILKEQNILHLINLFILNFYININNVWNLYKNNLIYIYVYNIYLFIKANNLVWYPIYKSYSIFGYYKSTRLKFIDLKNENLKRLKY